MDYLVFSNGVDAKKLFGSNSVKWCFEIDQISALGNIDVTFLLEIRKVDWNL